MREAYIMKTTQKEALKKLEQYVNLPSGSHDDGWNSWRTPMGPSDILRGGMPSRSAPFV